MSGVTTGTLLAVGGAAALSAGTAIYSANQQASSAAEARKQQQAQIDAAKTAPGTQQAKGPSQDTMNTAAGIGTGTNALGTGNFSSNTLLTGAQGVTDPLSLSSRKLYGTTPQTTTLLGA